MIRFTTKFFQYTLNQINIKIPHRTLFSNKNVQNQVTSQFQKENFTGISLGSQINHDKLKHKLPAFIQHDYNSNKERISILENYDNLLGYITNYRQVYGEYPMKKIEAPSHNKNSDEVIQAARLIVIRRRKMKKHKLKKLRKKMKFEWGKIRQRREMRKEKAFQAVLINQIKEAEKFSAEEYVASKIKKANEVPIPRFWKGKRLPQFIIKEKLGIK